MINVNPKYYLNKNVKPIHGKFYKVYFRFNLNGVNHRIKSQIINFLENEEDLNNYEGQIEAERKYVNILLNEYGKNYEFKNFENDFYNLNENLFSYYVSEEALCLKNKTNQYVKPIKRYGDIYINNLVNYLKSTTNLKKSFLFYSINSLGSIINLYKDEIPIDFIQDENIKNFIISCNNLMEFTSRNQTNLYKWFFEFQRLDFKEMYSESCFKLVDEFCIILYEDIFEKKVSVK